MSTHIKSGLQDTPLAQSQIRGQCPMSGVQQKSYRATNFGHWTLDIGSNNGELDIGHSKTTGHGHRTLDTRQWKPKLDIEHWTQLIIQWTLDSEYWTVSTKRTASEYWIVNFGTPKVVAKKRNSKWCWKTESDVRCPVSDVQLASVRSSVQCPMSDDLSHRAGGTL